jgi:hypothetical protein
MFDLGTIWASQQLPEDLRRFTTTLLKSTHEWCKKYSRSDDVGEYAKKEELWDSILKSDEFDAFSEDVAIIKLLRKYRLTDMDYKKRYGTDGSPGDFSAS